MTAEKEKTQPFPEKTRKWHFRSYCKCCGISLDKILLFDIPMITVYVDFDDGRYCSACAKKRRGVLL